jgi:hypothetical protein
MTTCLAICMVMIYLVMHCDGLAHDHGIGLRNQGLGRLGKLGHQDTKKLGTWRVTQYH